MELWIRSQDEMNLCKIKDLVIRENYNGYGDTDYVIQDIYTMGTYKTKERALEVLDEIQNILIDYSGMSRVVYQMPKE